ncbi:hypothetical protein WJX79_004298 [Trebouxia sp. C0005]
MPILLSAGLAEAYDVVFTSCLHSGGAGARTSTTCGSRALCNREHGLPVRSCVFRADSRKAGMARRRVQYGVVNASDADVGTGAPGFRATWQSKDDLRQQVMKISDVPKNGKLYFWDGQLWLRWEDPDDLPGPEGDPLRIKIVCPQNAEPKLPNFEANFRQLLVKSRFNCPKEVIVNTIVRRLPARMIACSSVQQAADLYEDASCLPGASTAKHLMTQNKLTVNGPLYPRDEGGPSCLLRAMNASGRPCIVKLLDTRELVHMDVKGDNIFVDMDGDWWLGDLGSAVEVGAAVQSTTDWFSQQKLKGQPAKTRYDWYMLAVALAAEVHKADWQEKLLQDGHTPADKVVAAVQEVQSQSLLDLLQNILRRAEVL